MRVSLKVLWATVGIVLLTFIIILFLWEIPAPQTEIHKNISIDHFFNKSGFRDQPK